MKTKLQKADWTEDQNSVLKLLALRTWVDRKELIENLAKEIPEVTPTQALYHAVTHEKLKFSYIRDQAVASGKELLKQGLDSQTVAKHIELKYGFVKTLAYWTRIRFCLRRGHYNIVSTPQGHVFQHRYVASKNQNIEKKQVMHPHTVKVNANDIQNLFVGDTVDRNKLKDINFVARILGLDYGTISRKINMNDFKTKTSETILTKLFEDSGLSLEAKNLFGTETT